MSRLREHVSVSSTTGPRSQGTPKASATAGRKLDWTTGYEKAVGTMVLETATSTSG